MTTNISEASREQAELLPCPFCGANNAQIGEQGAAVITHSDRCFFGHNSRYQVLTPRGVKSWNTRTVSPTAGWQPIETVPKDGSEILLGHANSIWIDEWIIDAEYEVGGYWMMCDQWSDPEIPTHWMRLPSPPQIALKPSSP